MSASARSGQRRFRDSSSFPRWSPTRRSHGSNDMAVSSVAAPSPPADGAANAPLAERLFPNNEWVLLVVIAVECLVFGMAGHNFATAGNAFEITRLGVEIGLLALALTPIIVTGGIDLSVGSMMGLAAIMLGGLWRDAGVSMPVAIVITLLVGLLGGA